MNQQIYDKYFFSVRTYNAYLAHRRPNRTNVPGGRRRMYPSFRTNALRIIAPDDVPSWVDPIFEGSNRIWVGQEVTQLRRYQDEALYLGRLNFI